MYKLIASTALGALCLMGQTTQGAKEAAEQKDLTLRVRDVAEFGQVSFTTAIAAPLATVAGAPYSAQAVTERVQTLADGNRIVQTTSGSVARDSQGRVRRDEALSGIVSGKGNAPHMIFIEDPVAGVHWNLDPQMKTAFKLSLPPSKTQAEGMVRSGTIVAGIPAPDGPPLPPPPPPPPGAGDNVFFYAAAGRAGMLSKVRPDDAQVVKTDLGTQTVEGVKATGTRVTRTMPAGAIGNEQPLVITTETWYSPELKVLLSSKTSDPRIGETTYKLTELQRAEPPADLFEVPADYTVKDSPMVTKILRDTKKND